MNDDESGVMKIMKCDGEKFAYHCCNISNILEVTTAVIVGSIENMVQSAILTPSEYKQRRSRKVIEQR